MACALVLVSLAWTSPRASSRPRRGSPPSTSPRSRNGGRSSRRRTSRRNERRVLVFGRKGRMKLPRRNFLHLAACAAALPVVSRFAWAQAYPMRPITIVVPFPAGGPTDTLARILAEHMRTLLGQSVIVENVTGASGSIGVGRVAKAAPDGYTLSIGHLITHVFNGAVFTLPYDPVEDFAPVSLLAAVPTCSSANKLAGQGSEGADSLAQGESGQGIGRDGGRRQRRPPLCHPFLERDGHALPTRALSRRCPDHAGLDRRADRPDVR